MLQVFFRVGFPFILVCGGRDIFDSYLWWNVTSFPVIGYPVVVLLSCGFGYLGFFCARSVHLRFAGFNDGIALIVMLHCLM